MKAVIDGKLYDTETAHVVAARDWHSPHRSYETMYQTRKGAWLLRTISDTGPPVIPSLLRGIHRTEVEKWIEWLNPLEDYEALQWLERYSSVDIILKHCADQVEEM